MTRKFLFCFPLRLGNIIFGYIVIIVAIAVMAFNLYRFGLSMVSNKNEFDEKFRNFEKVDNIFGPNKKELVALIALLYYGSYMIVAFLLFVFAALFTCGAYKANNCLISTFFGYSFIHLFLTVGLIVWEAITAGWIELGLIVAADLILIVCLFSVKYLMAAIRTGHMYTHPGEVYYKY
ncbi:uncharacterized protein LOC113238247 isoform X2 [Hyposmocoma kahamanoa]|nr:uncharacterized protein LOC113238247 isoform X2 [Hyposmocoma kahamanoa]XP_026330839.1 uncharacterized protein LOC113238247 isoform X2 [Hyposmocoma kahamanoa]